MPRAGASGVFIGKTMTCLSPRRLLGHVTFGGRWLRATQVLLSSWESEVWCGPRPGCA